MEKITLHIIGGWAYPPGSLEPLAHAMASHIDVIIHPFQVDIANMASAQSPWWLGGWSLGGIRAMQAVSEGKIHPDGLMLISSTARFCADENYDAGLPRTHLRAMIRGLTRDRDSVLDAFFKQAGGSTQSPFPTNELLEGLKQLDDIDLRDILHRIPVPVHLFHGEKDRIIPAQAARYLASRIPRARLFTYPDAGHDIPVRFAAGLARDFLSCLGIRHNL